MFVEKGVKINSAVYKEMLKEKVLPWAQRHFAKQAWIFQQDGTTSHISKTTQALCKDIFKDIIAKDEWPSFSPDLNRMDYSVWGIFKAKLTGKRFQSVATLNRHY